MADDFNYKNYNDELLNLNWRGDDGREEKYEEVLSTEGDGEELDEEQKEEKLLRKMERAQRIEEYNKKLFDVESQSQIKKG